MYDGDRCCHSVGELRGEYRYVVRAGSGGFYPSGCCWWGLPLTKKGEGLFSALIVVR